jgi:hypothetical protein
LRKIIGIISFCFLILNSCESKKDFEIKSIWYLVNNDSGYANWYRCDDCDRKSKECCEYEFRNEILHRMESFTLNVNGGIDSIYNYSIPLGVNIFSLNDKISLSTIDTQYVDFIKNFKVKYLKNENAIIINDSTYEKFENDRKNKFLILKNNLKTTILEHK